MIEIESLAVRGAHRLRDREIVRAVRIVEENREIFQKEWRWIHG